MKKVNTWLNVPKLVVIVLIAVIGFSLITCEDGNVETKYAKTLIIEGIPEDVYEFGWEEGGQLGLFPVGTTFHQAISSEGIAAGIVFSESNTIVAGSEPYAVIILLFNIKGNSRWTGSGTFDVYGFLGERIGSSLGRYYKAESVDFSSEMTIIPFSSVIEVPFEYVKNPPYGDGTFTGSKSGKGTGFQGEVTLTLTFENGMITEVEIIHNESFGRELIEKAKTLIPETNSFDLVDGLSGATHTLNGLRTAFDSIISTF